MEDKTVYEKLGNLGARMDNLFHLIEEMKLSDKDHKEYVRAKLEILDALKQDFKDAEPVIKDINKWKERTIGVVMFVSVLGGTLSFFVADIIHYIKLKLGF